LKIDGEALQEMMFPNCFLLQRIVLADESYRELAFSEEEAREFIRTFANEGTLALTLESKIKEFCDFLELSKT
jgi:hypothetical protein